MGNSFIFGRIEAKNGICFCACWYSGSKKWAAGKRKEKVGIEPRSFSWVTLWKLILLRRCCDFWPTHLPHVCASICATVVLLARLSRMLDISTKRIDQICYCFFFCRITLYCIVGNQKFQRSIPGILVKSDALIAKIESSIRVSLQFLADCQKGANFQKFTYLGLLYLLWKVSWGRFSKRSKLSITCSFKEKWLPS